MKIKLSSRDVEQGMKAVGGDHKYQIYLIACFIFVKIVTDSFYCPLPYFLTDPSISCYNKTTGAYNVKCKLRDVCILNKDKEEEEKIKFVLLEPDKITFINEFELMCEDIKIGILASSASIGHLLSNIAAPLLTDNLGRIKTILLISFLDIIVKSLIFVYKDLNFLIAILTMINVTNNIIYTSASLYINEMVDSDRRGTYVCFFNSFFGMSGIIYTIFFNFTNSWKFLQLFSIFSSAMAFILTYFFLDESIRFLYMKSKKDKVIKVFQKMAKVNNREANYEEWYNSLTKYEKGSILSNLEIDKEKEKELSQSCCSPIALIFKNKTDSYNFIAFSVISLVTVSGLIFNAVDMKHTEDTLLYPILFYTADLVLILVCGFLIDSPQIGRKSPCVIFSFMCSIFYILKHVIQAYYKDSPLAQNIFIIDFLIRFGVSISFNILIEYNFEIYSTDIRSTAFNLNKLFSRLGDFVTPLLMSVNYGLTTAILGFLYGFMTIFILYLKETRGEPLREQVNEEAEETAAKEEKGNSYKSGEKSEVSRKHTSIKQTDYTSSFKDDEEAACKLIENKK